MENKYVLGFEEDFHNFINSISEKDKIGIVAHTDTDGVVSAVILNKILESKDLKVRFIEFLSYGYDSLEFVLSKDYDKLFFVDWNLDMYSDYLEKLREKGNVLLVDHHPVNEDLKDKSGLIKTNYSYCSAHCLFNLAKRYFNTESLKKLTCAAIVSDYTWDKSEENFEFIKSVYLSVKKDYSIWNSEPGRTGELINSALIYYKPNYKKVYDLIIRNDFERLANASKIIEKELNYWTEKFKKEVEYFPQARLYFYYGNPEYSITSAITSPLSSKYFIEDTIIFISDIKDKKGFVKMSARNQTGKIDLGKLLNKCIEGFEDSIAGGHVKASGGSFPKKYLNEFKRRLIKELE